MEEYKDILPENNSNNEAPADGDTRQEPVGVSSDADTVASEQAQNEAAGETPVPVISSGPEQPSETAQTEKAAEPSADENAVKPKKRRGLLGWFSLVKETVDEMVDGEEDTVEDIVLPLSDRSGADNDAIKASAERRSRRVYINIPPPEQDEEEFWNEVLSVKPPRSRIKLVLWGALLAVIIAALLGYTFALQHGKGLLRSLLPLGERISFTLPIAEVPALDGKYTLPDGSYSAAGLAKAVLPSVVQIKSYTTSAVRAASQGSGIVLSEDGYIVTNAHVISGAELGVTVMLYDKSEFAAKVVGKDESSDIAVLKISAAKLTPAQFGDSGSCELGDEVVAIGSPAGFENSVTKGIISGLERQIHAENSAVAMECIQIDAAINPGNSGGPLFNMWGQVVGITSSKLVSTSYDNIGFAITIKSAKPIIERLIEDGFIPDRGRIGILYSTVSEEAAKLHGVVPGLYIQEIDESCDVANSGLKVGDIITEIAGREVATQKNVNEILDGFRAGDEIGCRVYRPAPDDDNDGIFGEGEYFDITFKLSADKTSMIEKKN